MGKQDIIFGRNPVRSALESERTIDKILVQEGAKASAGKIISLAKEKGVRIEYGSKADLDRLSEGGAHQGILARVSSYEYADLDDIIKGAEERSAGEGAEEVSSLVIILDEIEDPHNLGAIMRTAECTGADGIIIPKRRSVGLNYTVAKTSAGAIERVKCARVTNIVSAINTLKEAGFWVCAADMDGDELWKSNLKGKIALVIGNEGKGVSRLVKENCDFVVSIPMEGETGSLNASNAAAVIMYEHFRQRRA